MKECKRCKKEKSKEDFGDRSKCKECRKLELSHKRLKGMEFIFKHKRENACVDCGEDNPVVLDFDHVGPLDKKSNISKLAKYGNIGAIEKEIDKCEIRCANCHRIKTAADQDWYKNVYRRLSMRIQTYTGRMFHPFDPKPEQIDILDIAHALSMLTRYNGHLEDYYSVAQHSVYTSYVVPEEFAFEALMHDATEAYIGDMPSPVKRGLPDFQALENSIWRVIAKKYGINPEMSKETKLADIQILMAEKRDLVKDFGWDWGIDIEPASVKIVPVPQVNAKRMFLARFEELTS